ncbi:MAG: molybdopterin molybdenumtransferase MoeA, partial [Cycloclasticus sp.]|nr:molybdopterin molybdenumtransferase MoeA [Cycloclasticus sp.]
MSTLKIQSSCDDENEHGTLTVEQALHNMLNAVTEKMGAEQIHLTEAVDRVLTKAIVSSINVPSHQNSAVDGYAVHHSDLPSADETTRLTIVGQVVAGHPYKGPFKLGECIQIMTGAQIPKASDTVIMQEHIELHGSTIRIDGRHKAGQNVRQAGEDIEAGQIVLAAGVKLTPAQIGLIASLG